MMAMLIRQAVSGFGFRISESEHWRRPEWRDGTHRQYTRILSGLACLLPQKLVTTCGYDEGMKSLLAL